MLVLLLLLVLMHVHVLVLVHVLDSAYNITDFPPFAADV